MTFIFNQPTAIKESEISAINFTPNTFSAAKTNSIRSIFLPYPQYGEKTAHQIYLP